MSSRCGGAASEQVARPGRLSLTVGLATAVLCASTFAYGLAATTTPASAAGTGSTPAPIDPAPLVTIDTMAHHGASDGVLVATHRNTPLPGCPDVVTQGQSADCFYADPGGGSTWVQVVVLSRADLAFVANKDIPCPQATSLPQEAAFDSGSGGGSQCTAALSSYIASLTTGDLVIASNQPGPAGGEHTEPPVGLAAVLSSVGSNHGIGASAPWYNAPDHGAHLPAAVRGTFSAIGVPGWAPNTTISNSAASPAGPVGTGAISIPVAINNSLEYTPTPIGEAFKGQDPNLVPLTKVLFQPSSEWPEEQDKTLTAARSAALSRLGTEIGLGSDPRAQFYSQPLDYNWNPRLTDITKEDFAKLDPRPTTFDAADYEWAKQNLSQEIDDVIDVDNYVTKLGSAYTDAKSALWSSFGEVTSYVTNSVEDVGDERAEASTLAVIGAILAIAAAIPSLGAAPTIVSAAYSTAVFFATKAEQPVDRPFGVTAAHLGAETTDRLDAVETEIEVSWRNILVADYQKMRTVALCATPVAKPTCPDPAQGWQISTFDAQKSKKVLELGLERYLYLKLVPAKWHLLMGLINGTAHDDYVFHPDWKITSDMVAKDTSLLRCFAVSTSLSYTPFPKDLTGVYHPSGGEVYVLTNDVPGLDPIKSASADMFKRMFDKPDANGDWSSTRNSSGVGIDEDDFFKVNYMNAGRETTFAKTFPNRSVLCSLHYPGQ